MPNIGAHFFSEDLDKMFKVVINLERKYAG